MYLRTAIIAILLACVSLIAAPASAQLPNIKGSVTDDLQDLVSTPALPGYEAELAKKIETRLANFRATHDNLGNVTLTLGSGSPRRLIVAPLDEPGFVVGEVTSDGYLRVQRLPQFVLPPIFNELYSSQPVWVRTSSGKWIDGVVAGLSVHLQPGHTAPPKSSDLEEMYVDIGASSADEVRKAGVDNLSPIVINHRIGSLFGGKYAGASIGDRFGAVAVLEMLRTLDASKVKGTLTVAFVVQQWAGARGLQRILTASQYDEMVYVGRLLPGGPVAGVENVHRAPRREPGAGVLIGLTQTDGSPEGLAAEMKQLAESNKIPIATDYSAGIVPPSYLPGPNFPAQWAHIGIATAWPSTPAELIDANDLENLSDLLTIYLGGHAATHDRSGHSVAGDFGPLPNPPAPTEILRRLTVVYAASRHEARMREAITAILPKWAKPDTDDAGNLILRVGTAPADGKGPKILFVAHMDEIGIDVKSISKDGRLEADWSGGEMSFYAGHQALVHSGDHDFDAIYELPNGWDEPKFEWPHFAGRGTAAPLMRIDVGARSPAEIEKLGIKVGDWITIPKAYRPLLNKRANGRSFDDRVGCTALVAAAWALGAPLKDRDVTFVFSTGEEIGLVGAGKLAARLAQEGHEPDYVFAIDTFVSSDSPLENKRFADAAIGKGFVVRAIDNSNIVPPPLVEKVVKLARANQVPVQFGITGGGNDGSAFVRYGPVDVALGWPLRYSHSPAEVVDTRDVEGLARIVFAIAEKW